MDRHVPNTELTLGRIPLETAVWEEINVFAHSFNGYDSSGSFERCAEIAQQRLHDTLTDLRTCLFFEARSLRHGGEEPDEQGILYLRGLVRQIRDKVAAADLA